MNEAYLNAARLLVQVAPIALESGIFALKGGTAINLFVRDLPRLSVDLDLVFTDHEAARDEALSMIGSAIRRTADKLNARGFQTRAIATQGVGETKLLIRREAVEVKVEVNFIMRGTVRPPRPASLTPKARELLQADIEIPVVSHEDLYGGKLVAAMDRQHPRDLFDVMQLYAHGGLTPPVRRAFVVYLACHNRPVHEVLFPLKRDLALDYERTFTGMTAEPITLNELLETRDRLIADLHKQLDDREREFLLSLVANAPNWKLLDIEHLERLPGMRWKLHNIDRLAKRNPGKSADQLAQLRGCLFQTRESTNNGMEEQFQ